MSVDKRLKNKAEGHMSRAEAILKYSKEDKSVNIKALKNKRDAVDSTESKYEDLFLEMLEQVDWMMIPKKLKLLLLTPD